MWTLWQLLIGPTLVLGADFNTSVWLDVSGLSLIGQLPTGFSYNESTGLLDRTYFGRSISLSSTFVGTAFKVRGSLLYTPAALDFHRSRYLASTETRPETFSNVTFQENASTNALIASASGLELGEHTVSTSIELQVNCTYNKLEFEVPVLTQAPSFAEMDSVTDPVMEAGKLGSRYTVHPFASSEYVTLEDNRVNVLKGSSVDYSSIDNGIQVREFTELTYDVPENTTLLNITGPLGQNFSCYAALKPIPAWWKPRTDVPLLGTQQFSSHRAENRSSETFLVLPVDPTVKYKLSMGGYSNYSAKCNVGGVTSYSFYWKRNATAPNAATNTTDVPQETSSQPAATSGAATASQRKSSSPTGAIVGGVVGGVVGLLLLLLGGWWLWRRRRTTDDDASIVDDTALVHEPVRDTKADPPVLAPVMRDDLSFSTPSFSDQATTVNAISASSHVGPVSEREPKSTPTASGPSAPSATSPGSHDSPPSSPLVQYAEDAEDAAPRRREPLILPPRYKEAWGRPRGTESEDGTGVFRADDGGSKP